VSLLPVRKVRENFSCASHEYRTDCFPCSRDHSTGVPRLHQYSANVLNRVYENSRQGRRFVADRLIRFGGTELSRTRAFHVRYTYDLRIDDKYKCLGGVIFIERFPVEGRLRKRCNAGDKIGVVFFVFLAEQFNAKGKIIHRDQKRKKFP
jgi:hypothetical protein